MKVSKENLFKFRKIILFFVLISLVNSFVMINFLLEVDANSSFLPPSKQIKNGILPLNVKCEENFQLVFKIVSNLPSCVKLSSLEKIMDRGWGKLEPSPPNILIIVADDLAYTDLSVFGGGDISTPNLDNFAKESVILTNFHSLPTCSPTRSVLMTGVDNHLNGFGNMAGMRTEFQKDKPGYEGYLNERTVSIGQIFKDNGYHTYMSGKWHLGEEEKQGPYDKGFEEVFTLIRGSSSNFNEQKERPFHLTSYYQNNTIVDLPENYFSSDFYTDTMIEFIEKNKKDHKPMFMYLPFTAPHMPLQAPDEYIQKYKGQYDSGWDVLREERFENLKNLGIIPENLEIPIKEKQIPNWNELTLDQKKFEAKKMEIYAAMVSNMDFNIGKLFDYLKKNNEYDNTLIIFFSDNGAEATDVFSNLWNGEEYSKWLDTYDNSISNMGKKNSMVSYGKGWAEAGSVPFKFYKGYMSEGGNRVPFLIKLPYLKSEVIRSDSFTSVLDLVPTFLDYAQLDYPESYQGKNIHPLSGKSLRGIVEGEVEYLYNDQEFVAFELFGNAALYKGDYKILKLQEPWGDGKWRLYNIVEDPKESNDLSNQKNKLFQEMIDLYKKWEKNIGVIDDKDELFPPGYFLE
jgi:arylsulfatase